MPPYRSIRARPTFETAHSVHKNGGWLVSSPEHWRTTDEHKAEVGKATERLMAIVKEQFPRTNILEYAVLKAHLIIEFALDQFIDVTARGNNFDKVRRFNFASKLEVAILLGFGATDALVIPIIERLNTIRNQAAHKFTIDRDGLDEIFRVVSPDYHDFSVEHDRERIKRLRWLCMEVCAKVYAGMITFSLLQFGAIPEDPE